MSPTHQHLIPGKDLEFQEVLRLGCGQLGDPDTSPNPAEARDRDWGAWLAGVCMEGGLWQPHVPLAEPAGPGWEVPARWPKMFSCEIKTGKLVSIFTRKQGLYKGLSLHCLHVPPRQGLKHSLHWLNAGFAPQPLSGSVTLGPRPFGRRWELSPLLPQGESSESALVSPLFHVQGPVRYCVYVST